MDEIAVYIGQHTQTTMDFRDAISIYITSIAYENPRVTGILDMGLDGKKANPLMISEGKNNKVEFSSDVYILNQKSPGAFGM